MSAADTVKDALFDASYEPDFDDVMFNIMFHKHKEWLERNPEYTQSPYSTVLAEMQGQLPLFSEQLNKHMQE
jgi:hypothetical protein